MDHLPLFETSVPSYRRFLKFSFCEAEFVFGYIVSLTFVLECPIYHPLSGGLA